MEDLIRKGGTRVTNSKKRNIFSLIFDENKPSRHSSDKLMHFGSILVRC